MNKSLLCLATALLTILSAGAPHTALAQNGSQPLVSAKFLNFPPVAVGAISPGMSLTLTNPASSGVSVNSYSFAGDNFSFPVTSNCAFPLAPGASCGAVFAFAPTRLGGSAATLTLTSGGGVPPINVFLNGQSGSGNVPNPLVLSPASLTFPATALGSNSAAQTVTVTNPNSTAATYISSGFAGPDATDYVLVSNECPSSIQPNTSCTFQIAFAPVGNGTRPAQIVISTTADAAPQTIALTGIAGVRGPGIITTVAGTGAPGYNGDDMPAITAEINAPSATAVDSLGNVYIAEYLGNRVRKVDTSGTITTVAGIGTAGFSGDGGPATSAQLRNPVEIAVDAANNLYIGELEYPRIRFVSAVDGTITTIAGTGAIGSTGDSGPATNAEFEAPEGILPVGAAKPGVPSAFYFTDTFQRRIRKVDAGGIISTIAGGGPDGAPTDANGDGGPARGATLLDPVGIAIDPQGNLFFAENVSCKIRRIDAATQIITTIAGTGVRSYNGDNLPATTAQFNSPAGLVIDAAGDLYVSDSNNYLIRRIDRTSGIITNVVGQPGVRAFSGDEGPAQSATLEGAYGITIDAKGNLFIADQGDYLVDRAGNRVRKVTY